MLGLKNTPIFRWLETQALCSTLQAPCAAQSKAGSLKGRHGTLCEEKNILGLQKPSHLSFFFFFFKERAHPEGTKMDPFSSRLDVVSSCVPIWDIIVVVAFIKIHILVDLNPFYCLSAMVGFTHYSHSYWMSVIARTACYRNLVIMTCCEQPRSLSHTHHVAPVSLPLPPLAFLLWPLWSNLRSYVLDCWPRCLTPAFEISPLM